MNVVTGRRRLFPNLTNDTIESYGIDISIVVPAYCEENRLPVMLGETVEYLDDRCQKDPAFGYEVIIVDDGSSDRTTEVALEFANSRISKSKQQPKNREVRVMTLEQNRGKGGAVTQVNIMLLN